MGERNKKGESNYLVVGKDTPVSEIENTFIKFTQSPDIGVILINQHVNYKFSKLIVSSLNKSEPL